MTVYTCITNNKDNIVNVQRQEGVRFVCFTDNTRRQHPVWEFVEVDPLGLSDPRRIARRYKILSHIYFPDEVTIWVDGRVRLLHTARYYTEKYKGIVNARRHHSRTCIYDEAAEVKRINYDVHSTVDQHIDRIKYHGYPEQSGLHETGMVLRTPGCEWFNEMWWSCVSTGSHRDQLSFDYVAWHTDTTVVDVDRNEVQVLRHKKPTNATT